MRKRISPASESSISSLRRANETRAPFTTDRSLAIASSRRTKPWSSTRIVSSVSTSHGWPRRAMLASRTGWHTARRDRDRLRRHRLESCRFYRALGVDVGEPAGDDHFEATLPNGAAAHVGHRGADPQARSGVEALRGPRDGARLRVRQRGRGRRRRTRRSYGEPASRARPSPTTPSGASGTRPSSTRTATSVDLFAPL